MEKGNFLDKLIVDFNEFTQKSGMGGKEKANFIREIADVLAQLTAGDDAFSVTAQNAVVEVMDGNSLYRRYLEIGYTESGNGIRLTGENMKGEETSIVFISESAIERMNELRGKGPDKSPCRH